MSRSRRAVVALIVVAAFVSMAACTPGGQTTGTSPTPTGTGGPKGTIRVGSKIDVEGPVLGNIIAGVLTNAGYTVVDKMRTGTTDVVRKALLAGEIDVYPEYTANAIVVFNKSAKVDPSVLTSANSTYDTAKSLDASNGVVWLAAAPANNTWGVAIPKALADSNNIKTFGDWAAYINKGGTVKVIGSTEFFTSAAAMPAFEKAYDFKLKKEQIIALATGDTAVTEKAASQGTNGANAAMAYGTDPTIAPNNLIFLTDDKGVQPYYQPAPTFRQAVIDKNPGIPGLLDPVFAKLDATTLQTLNGQVAVQGQDPKTVATNWLKQEGFIK